MRVVGVNGINTHGEKNIDILLGLLARQGHETVDVRLPKRHWFDARWGGRHDGEIVADHSQEGDVLIAHSFGAVRAWYAHDEVPYSAIILIAPAQSALAEWHNPERVYCLHSHNDWVVRLGAWLPWHPFGRAGLEGYRQEGVNNIAVPGADHDDYFNKYLVRTMTVINYAISKV